MATKPMPRVRAGVSGNPVISISGTKRAHTGSTRSNSLSASTQGKTGLSLHSIDDLNTYKEIPKFSETSYLVHSNELDSVALSQKKEFMHHDKNIAVSTRSSPLGQMPSIATPQNNCSKFESGRVMVQSDCNSELETSDAEKLKELMMLQVSLISRQQDLLKLRDKEILQLKASNHSLKCRLERMERRISLVRKNHYDPNVLSQQFIEPFPTEVEKPVSEEPLRSADGATNPDDDVSSTPQASHMPAVGEDDVSAPADQPPDLAIKAPEDPKPHCSTPDRTEKKPELDNHCPMINDISSTSDVSAKSVDARSKCRVPVPMSFVERCQNQYLSSLLSSPLVPAGSSKDFQSPESDYSNVAFKICDRCPHCIAMATEIARLLSIASLEEGKEESTPALHYAEETDNEKLFGVSGILPKKCNFDDDEYDDDDDDCPPLLTRHPYHRQFWTSNLSDLAGGCYDPPIDGAVLHIPTWRVSDVSSGDVPPVTENVDDETYLKRHSKFETSEKRRKRWDIQRIREFRYNEKLRQKLLKQERCEGVVESFTPSVWDVESIEVQDCLPVNIFGHTLPHIKPREFSLDDYQFQQS